MTPDEELHATCVRLAELRGQNEWFDEAARIALDRTAVLIPDNERYPGRIADLGARRIQVRQRISRGSVRMKPQGYERLLRLDPELSSRVVSRVLPKEQYMNLLMIGKRWRSISNEVKGQHPLPDPEKWFNPWQSAEFAYELREAKKANTKTINAVRREAVSEWEPTKLWEKTPDSVSVYLQGATAGQRSCDFELLKELDPELYGRLVEETPGGEVTEYVDLRHLRRLPSQVDVYAEDAPDSVAPSRTGDHPAVGEDFFTG